MAGTGDGLFVMINHFTNCGQHLITISQLYHYNKKIHKVHAMCNQTQFKSLKIILFAYAQMF